ncbi:hypothetical protein N802_06015 [Knoellia sinensis KCTC 19936]|uniref:Uncharacterized protein n=1 Tax=Knoellia sinensis KCTC 19936 TaxID=1385520 RepID=A0A0A0IZY4_9MICO|nr:hypothetical protein [Knoellia sinensis]KGN30760.1 hypothetical protein N802_06015 [Knoellia sinensis KCTC 19936]
MSELPTRPFDGRDKWGHVAMYAAIAAIGLLLAWAAFTVDSENTFLRTLVAYTLVGVVLTLALSAAAAVTRHLPTLRESTFEGEPARGVHAWSPEWWHTNAVDLALAVGAFTLAFLGIRQGLDLRLPGIIVGVVGLWWLVRAALSLTSRRNNHGFWLTADELVLESGEGRVRCPRHEVTAVSTRSTWGLVVGMKDGVSFERCPWPWRRRSALLGRHHAVVDLTMTAHDLEDVAAWLSHELGLDSQSARSPLSRT